MSSNSGPTAATISIQQALDLLDGDFAAMAEGIGQRRYAFWLGSGISRDRVDDLPRMVRRVLSHLHAHIDPSDRFCAFRSALDEAVGLARLPPLDRARVDFAQPVADWPFIDTVVSNLCFEYSRLLDIRVASQPEEDYLLWHAVDVSATFSPSTATPDCEHYCIAILALEGVLQDVATANWDGLIEAAADELTEGSGTALQVCVRAEDLRQPPLLARLLKFHGCAVRAGADPVRYRPLLIASHSQITQWPHNPAFAQMREELVTLAVTKCTLMIGLSAQDSNIKDIFAASYRRMNWGWPCVHPAHVFTEETLGPDQVTILRVVYSGAYAQNGIDINAGALFRAFAKPALSALVLHVLFAKLSTYARLAEAPGLASEDHDEIRKGIVLIRKHIANSSSSDRLAFIQTLIATSSRILSLFQRGEALPTSSRAYRSLGRSPIHLIATDPALPTSGIREMAVAIGILGLGHADAI